ncbi:uncharacterized protein LOC134722916 [Mytilus trossulus]|uniref:uncharacterized protein LOC134722916 n=1 Tax=Mytilus trossulus TaxID=6551 RepID=UPI003006DA66
MKRFELLVVLKVSVKIILCLVLFNVLMNQFQRLHIGRVNQSNGRFWMEYYLQITKQNEIKASNILSINNRSCKRKFHTRMDDNMQTVLNYPVVRQMSKKFKDIFNFFEKPVVIGNETVPVIVTAASSNHYRESLVMINTFKKNILPRYAGIKLIIFDLGLTSYQKKEIQNVCSCEMRTFQFSKYPSFVRVLRNYSWKTLVIYTVLKEYNFVMWADASVRFIGTKEAFDVFFKKVKEVGILLRTHEEKKGTATTFYYTKSETFQLLNETSCMFDFGSAEATFVTIWKTPFTWKYIIQPWLACALTEHCMSHYNPELVLECKPRKEVVYHCHRFDQAVLQIILFRLFNVNSDLLNVDRLPKVYRIERL